MEVSVYDMTGTPREEFSEYLRRLGEHINLIYDKLKKIEARVTEISSEISEIKDNADVDRKEFNDFVNKLTESLKELLPPIPDETVPEESEAPQY
ncbi:MAG: hypothetical protein ACXACA_07210 [Candidatus Ranarchaeia archaeon]|jgi:uncharacterized protein YaaN involved in tellurite resistance